MNIFNKIVPWFIPTKEDQKRWYREELSENPKEIARLLKEFQECSSVYNQKLGDFEAGLSMDNYELYKLYLEVKQLAQQTNFLWNRIEYKQSREQELIKRMVEL